MTAWNIRPIASALLRNRTGALLVAFQIAIGLAVLVNAVYVVKQRVEKIGRPTGMDTATCSGWRAPASRRTSTSTRAGARTSRRCAACPGVKAASLFSNIPLSGGGSSSGYQARPGEVGPRKPCRATTSTSTSTAIAALGVKLIAGTAVRGARDPAAVGNLRGRRRRRSSPRRSPKELFPKDENSLGKTFYDGLSKPITIVGIIEHMHGAWVGWDKLDHVMLFPRVRTGPTCGLPRAHGAGPARRRDARHRGEARRLEPGPRCCAGCGRSTTSSTSLPRRPQHGDLPR